MEAEHRPKQKFSTIEVEEIPVIDMSNTGISSRERLASEIGNACKKWGFFQVINHGVPSELRRRVEKVMKAFFHLPAEEKRKAKRDALSFTGYHDNEHTQNVRDFRMSFDVLAHDPTLLPSSQDFDDEEMRAYTNKWLHNYPEFRETCEEYCREMEKLGFKLLELVSVSLGLPANRLSDYFKEPTSLLRLIYYPPCPSTEPVFGVNEHRDAGVLTLLVQDDVGGLQVKRQSDGEWIDVKPIPDAYIINVGDTLQVWSNDLYLSAVHRVMLMNSKRERISIPYFFLPSHDVTVKPLEELVSDQNPVKYKECNFGKYYVNKLSSIYAKRDVDQIQIDHFKTL